jgi:hypothetical protein
MVAPKMTPSEEFMTEQTSDKWLKGVALTTAVLAVFAAITTLYLGKFSSRAILSQGLETNQWGYFQSKSIKQHTYEIQKQRLELERMAQPNMPKAAALKYDELIENYARNIVRYEKEKNDIKAGAEAQAKTKADAQLRGGHYGYGLIFLQIGIMLSSVAALTRQKYLWYVGLAVTSGCIFFFLDAIYLFY